MATSEGNSQNCLCINLLNCERLRKPIVITLIPPEAVSLARYTLRRVWLARLYFTFCSHSQSAQSVHVESQLSGKDLVCVNLVRLQKLALTIQRTGTACMYKHRCKSRTRIRACALINSLRRSLQCNNV